MAEIAPGLTFGQGITDWQERINVSRMREERAARARQMMKKQGIPAMLATKAENSRYLTGLIGPEWEPQLWYVLFFAEHDPVVFAAAGWLDQMPDQAPWIKNWRIARCSLEDACGTGATRDEAQKLAADIHQELKKRGLAGEKLGIVGFDGPSREALREAGITLVDMRALMQELRSVKTGDEINCMKMVAAITEVGFFKAWQTLRPGIKDTELSIAVTTAMYQAGADYSMPINVRSGPVTMDRGFSRTGRLIQTGDLVYLSICLVQYMGYRSCTYRTLITGRKPNQRENDWFKKAFDVQNAVIDAIKPGATTADAAKGFLPAGTWGYKEEAELLTLDIGHGVGLAQYEPPIINRQWSFDYPQVFKPGMTIAVECRHGEHRVGAVRMENMLLVTDSGVEILDHTPRDRILEPMMLWG